MVEFQLLGAVSLTTDNGRDARSLVAQPRRLALLAYLAAATPRGTHRRDSLLAIFWPELDQPRARAALRQSLYVLREVLGPAALVSHGNEEGLADRKSTRLNSSHQIISYAVFCLKKKKELKNKETQEPIR